jgi:phosphate-selective porin OprO/OprP
VPIRRPPISTIAVGSADTLFLERASSAEISRALAGSEGRVGIGALGSGERWTASLNLTANTIGTSAFDEQLACRRPRHLPRLQRPQPSGASRRQRDLCDPAARRGIDTTPRYAVRLRDRPENRVDGTRLIDTGNIDADSVFVPGVEIALRYKALLIQAEHFWYNIERRYVSGPVLPDPDFTGWYVQRAIRSPVNRAATMPRTAPSARPSPLVSSAARTTQGLGRLGDRRPLQRRRPQLQ